VTGHARDRGAADALGLVLLAPVSIGLALLVVALGRDVDGASRARSAAEAAAQAASLERTPSAADAAARRVARQMALGDDSCSVPRVVVDTSDFGPGGHVTVTVECHASPRGLAPVRLGERVHSARAVASVDRFRSGGGSP
jgi:Flp pilus assembly protein TadG